LAHGGEKREKGGFRRPTRRWKKEKGEGQKRPRKKKGLADNGTKKPRLRKERRDRTEEGKNRKGEGGDTTNQKIQKKVRKHKKGSPCRGLEKGESIELKTDDHKT